MNGVDNVSFWARNTRKGERHRTEVTEVTKGGWTVGGGSLVDTVAG
jgi:hypothetical protein